MPDTLRRVTPNTTCLRHTMDRDARSQTCCRPVSSASSRPFYPSRKKSIASPSAIHSPAAPNGVEVPGGPVNVRLTLLGMEVAGSIFRKRAVVDGDVSAPVDAASFLSKKVVIELQSDRTAPAQATCAA